jgi:hypothetical protein
MNIRELFGVGDVARLMLVERSNYRLHPEYTLVNPNLIVGLELEIERWNPDVENRFRGFEFTRDGSLRGYSVEAITKPMYSKFVPEKLESFFKHFSITKDNYSERCSTHVHVNCQDLTPEQVASVCLLYQVFERAIFDFIGNERSENIFCTPWSQCRISKGMLKRLISDPNSTTANWQKYTALNLVPLRDKGTVEFRHLEGTCDIGRIVTWLNIIGSIFAYATKHKTGEIAKTIAEMNTVSNYELFMGEVFGPFQTAFSDLRGLLSQGVIDCKFAMLDSVVDVSHEEELVIAEAPRALLPFRWEDLGPPPARLEPAMLREQIEAMRRDFFRPAEHDDMLEVAAQTVQF